MNAFTYIRTCSYARNCSTRNGVTTDGQVCICVCMRMYSIMGKYVFAYICVCIMYTIVFTNMPGGMGEFVPQQHMVLHQQQQQMVLQQRGAGREFVPGLQFVPSGMGGGYDDEGSMMQVCVCVCVHTYI